jgi:hypothetical protein
MLLVTYFAASFINGYLWGVSKVPTGVWVSGLVAVYCLLTLTHMYLAGKLKEKGL